jgi:hypothetical protein
MQILGYIIIAVGIFLWCGNMFHFFPTFPLAGFATILIGGFVSKLGSKEKSAESEETMK